ncbi:MAG: alpha/beta hydrolase [Hyphomonadaceae bacterium]|nr:alpha/beta hydrolase [Hyphomonadaceae bacterium]
MAKLGLTLMAVIATAVMATSCGGEEKALLSTQDPTAESTAPVVKTGYADVNGLHVYYKTVGQGDPVVLLHGAYMSAEAMKPVTDILAKDRMVIVPEAQGHARTADIDRPITYEALADDVAALMDHLGVQSADVVGYSMGASTALMLAMRHPEKVKRMVAASGTYKTAGMYPEVVAMFPTITPEMFAGSPMETEYKKLSPTPDKFPEFVAKLTRLDTTPQDWPAKDIAGIKSPTLIVVGDQDVVTPEHAIEMFRLLGGGKPGDMGNPTPEDQLAILPNTSHIGVFTTGAEAFGKLAADFITPKIPTPQQDMPVAPEQKPQ